MTIRAVLLSHHFPLHEGDWKAPFVVARAQALAKRMEVTVVHAVPWTQGRGRDEDGAVRVRRARYLYAPGVGKRFDGRLLARAARDAVASAKPDVVEAQFGYPDGEAAVAIARELGCASAIVLRGTEQVIARYAARRKRLAAAFAAADVILPVSRTLADFARSLGAAPDRVRVVENGIDSSVFHPGDAGEARSRLGLPARGRILLGVGHLQPAKGYGELLAAFAALSGSRRHLRLVLVGDGPGAAALREEAARLGIADRVIFAGTQPHERVADYQRAADLFVHPSHSEGRPNVVLEAKACGLPAVATDVGGTREVVEEGVTGFLVPPRDPSALADAIERALGSPFDRAEVARRGRARSWDDTARDLEWAYAAAVARRGAAAGAG